MTSIEVPYSIAAALPTLSVMDITNDVSKAVAASGRADGIAYIHSIPAATVVRIQERETGFFEDLELLLERVVPGATPARERVLSALMGPHGSSAFSRGLPLPGYVPARAALLARRGPSRRVVVDATGLTAAHFFS